MERASSRIIKIPENIQVKIADGNVEITGPKGKLNITLYKKVKIIKKDNQMFAEIDNKKDLKFVGTTVALISNGIKGVQNGHQKILTIKGGGYKALIKDQEAEFFLGKSHSDKLIIPQDLKVTCPESDKIIVEGLDKARVGLMAKRIMSLRKPNPYKLKGILAGTFKLKPGKTANK